MTDNEIVKALECCINDDCDDCPDNFGNCEHNAMRNALDIINRQKAEIERLNKEHDQQFEKWLILSERTKEWYSELYEEAKDIVRAEAIKEFAERLKAELTTGAAIMRVSVLGIIDDLAKEMTEETA